MKKFLMIKLSILSALLSLSTAHADFIGFEGLETGVLSDSIVTETNIVTFGVEGGYDAWIADIGDPITAFTPHDTPAWDQGGENFLTGPSWSSNYFFDFEIAVSEFSLYLYDFRMDGGANIGDIVSLTAYSDIERSQLVGENLFSITDNYIDGSVDFLSINQPSSPIRAITLTFNDGGTGIDNIEFTTAVPEPSTMFLLVSGIFGLVIFRKKFME